MGIYSVICQVTAYECLFSTGSHHRLTAYCHLLSKQGVASFAYRHLRGLDGAETCPWASCAIRDFRSFCSPRGRERPHATTAHPYSSPAMHPFATATPILISVGSLEAFGDQVVKLTK